MRFRVVSSQLLGGLCGWAACAVLVLPAAHAQTWSGPCQNCPQSVPWPNPTLPSQPLMPGADQPNTTSPNETATSPNETATNQNNNANQNEANNNQDNSDSNFSGSEGLASGASGFASPGGYLDDAIPQTMFKLRYDSESGINRFDRADYMFGTWREGSFHTHALVGGGTVRGTFSDPKATGSQIISNDVSDQILSAAMEYAFSQRLSVFVDVPYQFVHFGPDLEDAVEPQGMTKQAILNRTQFPETEVRNEKQNPIGAGDIQVGFKYAFIAEPDCRYLTFQFRTYVPTGDPGLGLGTGHVSVEPSLLAYQRLTDQLVIQGQLTDWIPIAAGPGAGNVVQYGAGIGYDVVQRPTSGSRRSWKPSAGPVSEGPRGSLSRFRGR